MKSSAYFVIIILILVSGCTQVVTALIEVTGSVVGATIDVADTASTAVSASKGKEKED